ncbi:curli production assembly/transport component CsgF [Sediminicola luteus]|uniref:Curli production assembly/transport component CsgF n=1 Tax=Sediminicola luteus TaxID=319238 RepID=A0ABV2TSB6_9FLAO
MSLRFLIILVFCGGAYTVSAQQLSYEPLNPAFGGNNFNYGWMLSSATAQNGLKAPVNPREQESSLDRFGNSINSQILSQISRSLLRQQVDAIGNFTEPGTYTYGNLNIEVFESDEGLVINILDTSTGEQTQVIVPN